jgi:hypothetical protein
VLLPMSLSSCQPSTRRLAGFAPKAVQNRQGVVYREVQDFTPSVEMSIMWRRDNTRLVIISFLQVVDEVSKSAQEEALAASAREVAWQPGL